MKPGRKPSTEPSFCECGNPSAPGATGGTHGRACLECRAIGEQYHHYADTPRQVKPTTQGQPPTPPSFPLLDTNTLPYGLARHIRNRFTRPVPFSGI